MQHQYIKFSRNWSTWSVFFQCKHEDLLRGATEVSKITAGHPGYLGALQREITRQWNDLSLEKRERFQALANEWTSGSAPDDVKRRQVVLSDIRSLRSSSNIKDGILHAEADHLRLPNAISQGLWSLQSGPDFI